MKQLPTPVHPEPEKGRPLICHVLSPVHAIDAISVAVEALPDGRFWLRYHFDGPLDELALPGPDEGSRADGLWQTTCCELFLRRHDDATDYLEFNFSPSSQWAAYHFFAYRENMANLSLPAAPDIALDASASHLALEVLLTLPPEWQNIPLAAALSAVIEEADGTKSYWALRHPPGQPDFHHPDCFALTLGAPDAV